MDKLNNIAIAIARLTDEELSQIDQEISEQENATYPLKMKKQTYVNETGKHNRIVFDLVKEVRSVIHSSLNKIEDIL